MDSYFYPFVKVLFLLIYFFIDAIIIIAKFLENVIYKHKFLQNINTGTNYAKSTWSTINCYSEETRIPKAMKLTFYPSSRFISEYVRLHRVSYDEYIQKPYST